MEDGWIIMDTENRNVIRFYRARGEYGYLSNLFPAPIAFEGKTFPNVEYAYQYGKFREPSVADWAMTAPKPYLIALIGHGLPGWAISEHWSQLKIDRMKDCLRCKFEQHPDLCQKLLDTKDSILIEESKTDPFWGIGKKGNGKNMLGLLLMNLRYEILEKKLLKNTAERTKEKIQEEIGSIREKYTNERKMSGV